MSRRIESQLDGVFDSAASTVLTNFLTGVGLAIGFLIVNSIVRRMEWNPRLEIGR